jgi:2-amino-4-hydroxy-6-hydroxymethyldihydropteridine diphosphokinase
MMRPMSSPTKHKVCLSLGANIGDRLANLRAAKQALARYMTLIKLSPVYETDPAYVTDQPDFLNAAVLGETELEPLSLLYTVKEIERTIGRLPTFRFGPRVIDIDILFYGALRLSSPELSIPHASLHERAFVLRPLADIAADWRHPVTGLTVRRMLDEIHDNTGVRAHTEAL